MLVETASFIFIVPESDHCSPLSLTNSCLVNLIDVTLACEDANSKLVDVDQEMCKNLSYGLIEVNLVSRTQPSDPLHLCQCLN